jgi:hypothetical protein
VNRSEVNDGYWHHIVGVYEYGDQRLFVDGDLVATGNATNGYRSGGRRPVIGDFNGDAGGGRIDEVQVFDRPLGEEQVKQLFAEYNDSLWGVSEYNTSTFVAEETVAGERYSSAVTLSDGNATSATKVSNELYVEPDICMGRNITVPGKNTLEWQSAGQKEVVWDGKGNISVKDDFLINASVDTSASFTVENTTNTSVASVSNTSFRIDGELLQDFERRSCSALSEGLVIRNRTGGCVGYIDRKGDMWNRGGLCVNATI